jgi:hypothetical protein
MTGRVPRGILPISKRHLLQSREVSLVPRSQEQGRKVPNFVKDQLVYSYNTEKKDWYPTKVRAVCELPDSYLVGTKEGRTVRRTALHLRPRVQDACESDRENKRDPTDDKPNTPARVDHGVNSDPAELEREQVISLRRSRASVT